MPQFLQSIEVDTTPTVNIPKVRKTIRELKCFQQDVAKSNNYMAIAFGVPEGCIFRGEPGESMRSWVGACIDFCKWLGDTSYFLEHLRCFLDGPPLQIYYRVGCIIVGLLVTLRIECLIACVNDIIHMLMTHIS